MPYSSTLAYLNAVARVNSSDATAVVPEMKHAPFEDPLFGHVSIRADGRTLHSIFLFRVKARSESHGPWDDYTLIGTTLGQEAFGPPQSERCPLVK